MAKGLAKGKTNNPAGRPKGTANPVIMGLREEIRAGVSKNKLIRNMLERLEMIEDHYKYVQSAMAVLDMVMPKLASEQPEEIKATIDWYADIAKKLMTKVS